VQVTAEKIEALAPTREIDQSRLHLMLRPACWLPP
jgi:hypothetical protein